MLAMQSSTVPSGSDSKRINTVKILLKFEVLGPRNGRGATCQNGFQSTVRL